MKQDYNHQGDNREQPRANQKTNIHGNQGKSKMWGDPVNTVNYGSLRSQAPKIYFITTSVKIYLNLTGLSSGMGKELM